MYIDTHCHLSKEYYDDISSVMEENKKAGIEKIIISGCEKAALEETIEYTNSYNMVYATIGFHPDQTDLIDDKDIKLLKKLILNNKKIVGIGEIGLDYHYGSGNKLLQQKLFRKQLALADELNLPVVIHSRDATKDTIDILSEFTNVKGVIHCFSGSYETANIYISMGYKLGIGGVLTFKNSKLHEVIKKISIDNLLFETDSPYLTPEPYRGKKNSSKYIPIIAKKLVDIKKISLEKVEQQILINTYNVFDLDR